MSARKLVNQIAFGAQIYHSCAISYLDNLHEAFFVRLRVNSLIRGSRRQERSTKSHEMSRPKSAKARISAGIHRIYQNSLAW